MRKRNGTPRLRIAGAVTAMNKARQALSAGIPPDQAETFRSQVQHTIEGLEEICSHYRMRPQDLPAPSYRAYCFLKSIDLNDLPVPPAVDTQTGDHPEPVRGVSVPGLLAFCEELQGELDSLARLQSSQNRKAVAIRPNEVTSSAELISRIKTNLDSIDRSIRQAEASPGELPDRSRRAYAWLKFLAEADHLRIHLNALNAAASAAEKAACRKSLPDSRRKLPVHIRFFNSSSLYRARPRQDGLHLTVTEGFIAAGPEVFEALVCAALSGRSGPSLHKARRFAEGEDFAEILTALELAIEKPQGEGRGRYFDLEQVFQRVNHEYFGGELERPRLTWNRTITHRKLGHYQPVSDTILVSISLDHPEVPSYVIDFVMYHELLHKKMGISVVNGRRNAHNPAFRKSERQFRYYSEAQEYLKQMGIQPL